MNRRIQPAFKRAFDIAVSFTVLTLLSPLLALIAPAIKLDDHLTVPGDCDILSL